MATRRRLLQFPSLLAQQALRSAIPKPRPPPNPHRRFLHYPSPSSHLLWRSSGSAGSLLPMSAAAAAAATRAAAGRWLAARGAGSLELFSLQRRRSSGWLSSSPTFLRGAPWAHWIPSADGVVWMLIGANVAVYMLWGLADPRFMVEHFMISLDNFKSGRLHTLLTNAFSHAEAGHLFTNMITLYFFGSSIASMFGPAFLSKLYIAGALAGSTFFLLEKAFLAPWKQVNVGWDNSRTSGLGASAAVNAIMLLQIFLYPKGLVYLYFVIPIPAALVGAAFIGADLWRVNKGWRLLTNPDSLCVRVLRGTYFHDGDFLSARKKKHASHTWRAILFGREALLYGLIKRVGDGATIKFWDDHWIPMNFNHQPTAKPPHASAAFVRDLIDPLTGGWDLQKVEENFFATDVQSIICIPCGRLSEDLWAWAFEKHGNFSVRSAYRRLMLGITNLPVANSSNADAYLNSWWRKLWKIDAPPKVRSFWWRVVNDFMPCQAVLKRRHMEEVAFCEVCGAEEETTMHTLLSCT